MPIDSLRTLFEHGLMDAYDAETRNLDALAQMSRDATDPRVRQLYDEHHQQTQGQVQRLRKAFDILHREPSAGEGCQGMIGLVQERTAFKEKGPTPEMMLVFDLMAAAKAEHYEIAAYTGLVDLAGRLGLDDVKSLLGETLAEEQRTLERVVTMAAQPDLVRGATGATREAKPAGGSGQRR